MWLWRSIGVIAFIIGAIGIVLPIWPTTIFWIVAAICFARSNPTWRDWIYSRPALGPAIEGFVERGVLQRVSKVAAIAGMGIALIGMSVAFWGQPRILIIGASILVVGCLFVLTRPTE